MVGRRAPAVSSAPAVAEQEARIAQMEAELRAADESRATDAANAAAKASRDEADLQRRTGGRRATIKTGPQGVLTGNTNDGPVLKTVLG